MKDDVKVAKELVTVARELSALGLGTETSVDPEAVGDLAAKFLSRLGPAKSKQLRMYGLELRPTDTVEQLAHAWATVLLTA
jgi:hypothetical protein